MVTLDDPKIESQLEELSSRTGRDIPSIIKTLLTSELCLDTFEVPFIWAKLMKDSKENFPSIDDLIAKQ
jgi:hypothetical protein